MWGLREGGRKSGDEREDGDIVYVVRKEREI